MLNPRIHFGGLGNRLFQMSYIMGKVLDGELPDIYIQDFKYFEKHKNEIRVMLEQGIPARKELIALHIRRGDYVDNPFYKNLLETTYYEDCIKLFPTEKFLIFYRDRQGTNDYQDREFINEWLTKKGIKYEIWEGQSEVDDLNALASCKGIIGANSSFSVWGAFISPYSEKTIFPTVDKWYSDGIERTVLPKDEGWIRL